MKQQIGRVGRGTAMAAKQIMFLLGMIGLFVLPTLALELGAGLNVDITAQTFFGIEGRYVWANPSFGKQKINLNSTRYALNEFKLNGFTT
jgi:hypothetical protein